MEDAGGRKEKRRKRMPALTPYAAIFCVRHSCIVAISETTTMIGGRHVAVDNGG
jgi:hypothetical protein